MIMFCVSSGYLKYIEEESRGYSFNIQGYGSFEKAIEGLGRTNASEILGFIILDNEIHDPDELEQFLKYCDVISVPTKFRKRMVISLNDLSEVAAPIKAAGCKNLDLYAPKHEIVTDTFIKRDLFGTVLTSITTPYSGTLLEDNVSYNRFSEVRGLAYDPLFSQIDLKALDDVILRGDVNTTIVEDEHLEYLKSSSTFHYRLRLYWIKREFSEDTIEDYDYLISASEGSIKMKLMVEYVEVQTSSRL